MSSDGHFTACGLCHATIEREQAHTQRQQWSEAGTGTSQNSVWASSCSNKRGQRRVALIDRQFRALGEVRDAPAVAADPAQHIGQSIFSGCVHDIPQLIGVAYAGRAAPGSRHILGLSTGTQQRIGLSLEDNQGIS